MKEFDPVFHKVEKNLGKFLFPHSERWQREKKIRTFLWILVVELGITAVIVLLIFSRNSR